MTTLTEIYQVLKSEGLCQNQTDFSQQWLGRSPHYMSQLKGNAQKASLTSLYLLASRLKLAANEAKDNSDNASYRRIRGAYIAASTILVGVYERRHGSPYYSITTLLD